MPTYVSNRFPYLKIGDRIAFQEGSFTTEEPDLVAQIETNEWFGIHVHPRDLTPEPIPNSRETGVSDAGPADETSPVPRVYQGRRSSRR